MSFNKFFIWIFVLLGFITFVSATDICLNPIPVNTTCFLVTPTLYCSVDYNYSLFDNDGNLLENGTLLPFNMVDVSYYFNFSRDVGTYYVRICDGSTRQLIVEGDTMIGFTTDTWLYIIIFLMFILFIWLAFKLTPLFLALDGIIMFYFAYYSYTTLNNYPIVIILSLVGLVFIFVGGIGAVYKNK